MGQVNNDEYSALTQRSTLEWGNDLEQNPRTMRAKAICGIVRDLAGSARRVALYSDQIFDNRHRMRATDEVEMGARELFDVLCVLAEAINVPCEPWLLPGFERALAVAEDCSRMFADIVHFDLRRATWYHATHRGDGEPLFRRLIDAWVWYMRLKHYHEWCHGSVLEHCFLLGGEGLWGVSVHILRALESSSPPPPPYTLFAFNIEMPPIGFPEVTLSPLSFISEDSTPEDSKATPKRKKTYSKEVSQVLIQRLIRLADQANAPTLSQLPFTSQPHTP